MKQFVYRNRVTLKGKLQAFAFGITLFCIFYYFEGREVVNPFFTLFAGSLLLYGVYYPWTQLKELVISRSEITQKERIGFGFKVKEHTVLQGEVKSFELRNNELLISTFSKRYRFNISNLILYKTIENGNSMVMNEIISSTQVYDKIRQVLVRENSSNGNDF